MSNVVSWLKGNWVIVLLTIVSLAVVPTAWYFADGMRTKVREDLQKKVTADSTEFSNAKVTYSLMSVEGDKILEKKIEPTKAYTEWYKAEWEKIRSATGTVSEAALTFNQKGHEPLVKGLFPDPEGSVEEVKPREFAAAYVRAHSALLKGINAGEPRDPGVISALLNDFQFTEIERIKNQSGKDPIEEDKQRLAESMRGMRMGEYQRRAAEIAVYAGTYVFEGVPTAPPTVKPSAAQCWDWQERYWIHQDICAAISEANKSASGQGVPGAVVKRIVRISARPSAFMGAEGHAGSVMPTEAGTDKAPLDYARSITGRYSGPGTNNKWFDVRNARVEVIVSSRRLPELFDALARTNFMSVLDMDLFRVDPIEELKSGYFYSGDDPVVRAVLEVETVWLREWRKDLMPLDVRKALGLVEGIVADVPDAGAAPAPRRAPPGGGDEDLRPSRGRREDPG